MSAGRVSAPHVTDMQTRCWTLAAACALAATIVSPKSATACDCIRLKPLSAEVRSEAPVIFVGTVLEITERNEHISTTYAGGAKTTVRPIERRVTFQVTQAWNGVTEEKIDIGADLSDCMFPFAIGRSYVVFAHKDDHGRPWTSICMRTTQREKADDIIGALGTPAFQAKGVVKNLP
jgi:hypothetical protein